MENKDRESAALTKLAVIIEDRLGVETSEVIPEASFINDLGADSLDNVEIVMDIEKVYCIKISDSDAENFYEVGDVIKYLIKNNHDV